MSKKAEELALQLISARTTSEEMKAKRRRLLEKLKEEALAKEAAKAEAARSLPDLQNLPFDPAIEAMKAEEGPIH